MGLVKARALLGQIWGPRGQYGINSFEGAQREGVFCNGRKDAPG